MKKDNLIVDMSFAFAVEIIKYSETLEQSKKFCVARQLIKSGTSIGANVREAQGAESKDDFIHKLKVAYKEAEETAYWLELCLASASYPDPRPLLHEIDAILRILGKIISSSKGGGSKDPRQ